MDGEAASAKDEVFVNIRSPESPAKELTNLNVKGSSHLIPFHSLIAEMSDEGIGFVKRFREFVCFHGGE